MADTRDFSTLKVFGLTLVALLAFASNSLLCRLALRHTDIDAATFTSTRLVSGAVVLWLIVRLRAGDRALLGNWGSSFALFAYAALFSFAYLRLSAGTGALLLFGAVQVTMISWGIHLGERLRFRQWVGLFVATGGLFGLVLPGLSAPPWQAAATMLAAGVAWGAYSIRGRGIGDAIRVTAGNFLRAAILAIVLSAATLSLGRIDNAGAIYAILSGAAASALGYVVWYTALRGLTATVAATVQLSVPVFAALGGVLLLSEPLTPRLILAAVAVLGGIALVILRNR